VVLYFIEQNLTVCDKTHTIWHIISEMVFVNKRCVTFNCPYLPAQSQLFQLTLGGSQ